jgi:hypothetical protein
METVICELHSRAFACCITQTCRWVVPCERQSYTGARLRFPIPLSAAILAAETPRPLGGRVSSSNRNRSGTRAFATAVFVLWRRPSR